MRLLVTGAAGMLGRDVVAAAESAGHDVVALARRDLDITDADAVRAAVEAARSDAVINCAAWTDVDGAEEHEADATRINGDGAGNLAAVAPFLVHVSSDYVFDGTATAPYVEADPTGPASAYGRSKLAGEHAVAAAERRPGAGDHAIVRSAWLFGAHGKNFVATMLKLAEDRDEVNVVADQIGCPTFTGHLGPALVEIAERRVAGILHVAGGGQCSWQELAQATFDEAGTGTTAQPVTTAEFPRPAPRPAWSVLRSTRPDAPVLPYWRHGLSSYLQSGVLP
jgi:dTDP-4-dehydrorhamnose reductase